MPAPDPNLDQTLQNLSANMGALVNGVNSFLASLSDAGSKLQNAINQAGTEGPAQTAAQNPQAAIDAAFDQRDELFDTLDADTVDSLTDEQRDLVESVGQAVGDVDLADQEQTRAASEQLSDIKNQLDNAARDVESRSTATSQPLPVTATDAQLAQQAAKQNELDRQSTALQSASQFAGTLKDAVDTLRGAEAEKQSRVDAAKVDKQLKRDLEKIKTENEPNKGF
jgi:hypothetical protein